MYNSLLSRWWLTEEGVLGAGAGEVNLEGAVAKSVHNWPEEIWHTKEEKPNYA